MKNAFNWFFRGTYLWHLFLAFATFGWGLNYENLYFMKIIGATFAAFALTSVIFTIIDSKNEKKAK